VPYAPKPPDDNDCSINLQILSPAHGGVPTGLQNPFGPNWAVLILPFIEQDNLYKQANAGLYPGVPLPMAPDNDGTASLALIQPTGALNWTSIAGTPLKIFQCPSDSYNQINYLDPTNGPVGGPANGWARGNYGASSGYEDFDHTTWGASYKTAKAGIPKSNGMVSSPVMSANYGAGLLQITDGTSNTIMVAELRAGLSPIDPRGVWALGFPGSSIVNAGRASYNPTPNNLLGGTPDDGGDELENGVDPVSGNITYCTPETAAAGMGCTQGGVQMTSAMSRSRHSGGVNVVFADGSVHFISNGVSQLTWVQLLSKSDGQVLGSDY
jgi:prepilin-type processing-associated H-X9-DG protein